LFSLPDILMFWGSTILTFPGGKGSVSVKLATHLNLVPRSKMYGTQALSTFIVWCLDTE